MCLNIEKHRAGETLPHAGAVLQTQWLTVDIFQKRVRLFLQIRQAISER